jgi:hypothetical protein
MHGFMLYCICYVTHHRVSLWYLILSVALSDWIRGIDGLFPFKCGLASKAGLRHLSWNNSGSSATFMVSFRQEIFQSYVEGPSELLWRPLVWPFFLLWTYTMLYFYFAMAWNSLLFSNLCTYVLLLHFTLYGHIYMKVSG